MTPADRVPRRTLWALAALRVAAGLVVASLTLTSDHLDERGLETALGLLVGWSFCCSPSRAAAVGGADMQRGSGLRGLLDRVAALDGRLELERPPGRGTRVEAAFPVGSR